MALALVVAGAVAVFVAFPTYPAYDSLYSLLWAGEVWDGQLPGFDDYRAPTQHPLLLPVGLVLGPFGDAGARAFVALCLAGMVALVVAMYRLGRLVAGVPGGLVAAALLLTRFNFGLLASKGYLDIPYCALLTWAIVLEAERPRRGRSVWWLLGLAGLLRPEAWLLAGVYGLWLGRGGLVARLRALLPAFAAPALWAATDFVVTGDPLFSIHHTDALAAELQREIPYSEIPGMSLSLLTEILKVPLLVLAGIGIVLAVRDRRRALAVPGVVAVVTLATYYVIATGGLPTVYRYLLPAGIGLLAFAAYALTGWTRLPAGSRARTPWIAAAIVRRAPGRRLHRPAAQPGRDGRPAARAHRAAQRALRAAARPGGGAGVGLRSDHRAQPQAPAGGALGARVAGVAACVPGRTARWWPARASR